MFWLYHWSVCNRDLSPVRQILFPQFVTLRFVYTSIWCNSIPNAAFPDSLIQPSDQPAKEQTNQSFCQPIELSWTFAAFLSYRQVPHACLSVFYRLNQTATCLCCSFNRFRSAAFSPLMSSLVGFFILELVSISQHSLHLWSWWCLHTKKPFSTRFLNLISNLIFLVSLLFLFYAFAQIPLFCFHSFFFA